MDFAQIQELVYQLDYFWLKAIHIIFVITWMAGLLYLPRLFMYHAQVPVGSEASELLKVMERRLYYYIMMWGMVGSWIVGIIILVQQPALLKFGWMHGKLGLVVLLTGVHHIQGAWRKRFARDENHHSEGFFRLANEIPTVIMIATVILAVVKPF